MFINDKTPTPEETPETTEKTTVPPPQPNPEEKVETPEAEDASHAESGEAEEAKAEEKAPEKPEPPRALALTDIEPSLSGSTIEEREGEKFIKLEDLPEDFSYSPEERKDLEKLYSETLTEIKEGEIVSGKIIAISEKEIAVDIGFKSEGILAIEEFDDPAELKVGDAIDVYLDSVEDSEGRGRAHSRSPGSSGGSTGRTSLHTLPSDVGVPLTGGNTKSFGRSSTGPSKNRRTTRIA